MEYFAAGAHAHVNHYLSIFVLDIYPIEIIKCHIHRVVKLHGRQNTRHDYTSTNRGQPWRWSITRVLDVSAERQVVNEELTSEDDERCYDEEHGEDTEAETINNLRQKLPLTAHLLVFTLIVHLAVHFLQHVRKSLHIIQPIQREESYLCEMR